MRSEGTNNAYKKARMPPGAIRIHGLHSFMSTEASSCPGVVMPASTSAVWNWFQLGAEIEYLLIRELRVWFMLSVKVSQSTGVFAYSDDYWCESIGPLRASPLWNRPHRELDVLPRIALIFKGLYNLSHCVAFSCVPGKCLWLTCDQGT